jgi:hypothetical protein
VTEATLEPDASRLDSTARARRLALAVLALALPTAVIAASTRLWRAPAGLAFAATSETTAGGATEDARPLDATALRDLRSGTYTVVWHGYWLPAHAGGYRVAVRSAAPFEMRVAGRTLRGGGPGSLASTADVVLEPGPNAIDLRLTGAKRGTRLRITRAVEGRPQQPFDTAELWARQPSRFAALLSRVGPQVEVGAGLVAAVALVGLLWTERRRALTWLARLPRLRPSPRLAWALGLVVVLYAGALRAEALIVRYGKDDLPAWARRLEAPLRELHPARLRWKPVERRYVGDPGAYLRHARAMEGFYDPRFREPFFVYSAKLGVALSGGRDIGISLASAAFSTLTVAATFLLGARAVSPWVGLLASLGFALDQHVIALSPEGWRDDAFAFLCAGFAWAALGLYDRGRFRDALILGLFGGFACLTRVTSLSFVVVALGVLALVPRSREWRVRGERVAVAGVVCAALIVPFLLSCWIAWGDPLVSINGVAPAYQAASGLRGGNEMGVMEYLAARFRAWELLDTVVVGATAYPFARKWNFDYVSPYASALLAAASAVGMLLMTVLPRTRLLVALFVAALVPFTLTWNVKGGSAWRLTLFAYPFYLVAGAFVLWSLARLAVDAAERSRLRRTLGERATWVRLGVVSGAACLVALGSLMLPYQRARETLGRAQPARVTVGPRDRLFFGPGWQSPACNKNVCARYTSGSQSWIHLPLPPGRDYTLRLRAQPMALPGMRPQRLTLLGNGTPIGDLALPESKLAGLYEARWPSSAVKDGQNRLEIRAAYAVEVGEAGATDPLARPGTRTAFSLQYLDIAPTGQASGPAVRRRQGRERRGSSDKPRESSRPTAPS